MLPWEKKIQLFVFRLEQATWNASSSMTDYGYSKQMSGKKTNCVSLQLASQQGHTEEAKPRELRPIWKYLKHFAHISQDDWKQAEQGCTIKGNRNLAASVTFQSKTLQLQPVSAWIWSYQPGASPLFHQCNLWSILLCYWSLMFLKGRLIPLLLMEWLCC